MATKKTPRTTTRTTTRTATPRVRRAPVKVQAKAAARPAATDFRRQISDAFDSAREATNERMQAGLGLISRMRKESDERFAKLVAEGKRVQPKVDKAIENLKKKIRTDFRRKIDWSQYKPDLSKFEVDTSRFSRKAIEARFEARMTDSLHLIGLPTRKEVQALARKVDKLAAAQAA
jgi:poly(hydroxyalkanoate) granule-associated protein